MPKVKKKRIAKESKVLCAVELAVEEGVEQERPSTDVANDVVSHYCFGDKLEILAVLDDERYEDMLDEMDTAIAEAVRKLYEEKEREGLSRGHWEFICRLSPEGHKLFKPTKNPSAYKPLPGCTYAIADNSGGTPNETDDGVLWVDGNRPLMLTTGVSGGICVLIPVVCMDGVESTTPSNTKAARTLQGFTGMKVVCEDPDLEALLK